MQSALFAIATLLSLTLVLPSAAVPAEKRDRSEPMRRLRLEGSSARSALTDAGRIVLAGRSNHGRSHGYRGSGHYRRSPSYGGRKYRHHQRGQNRSYGYHRQRRNTYRYRTRRPYSYPRYGGYPGYYNPYRRNFYVPYYNSRPYYRRNYYRSSFCYGVWPYRYCY